MEFFIFYSIFSLNCIYFTVTKPKSTSKPSAPPPRPAAPPSPQPPRNESLIVEPELTKDHAEADLLNLNRHRESVDAQQPSVATKDHTFDLLGGFHAPPVIETAKPDQHTSNGPGLDDIFGAFESAHPVPTLTSNKSSSDLNGLNLNFGTFANAPMTNGSQQQSQSKEPSQGNKDPFADLGNLASGLSGSQWGSGVFIKPSTTPSPQATQFSSPTHHFSVPNTANPSPRFPSTPSHQVRSPNDGTSKQPDYSRSNFEPKTNTGNDKDKDKKDIFGDILGEQGYM